MRDEKRANYDGALTFAEAAIKSAFALNGGGIVALPALTALLKIEPKPAATCIIVAVGAFVVGLICAAATSFLGYLSAMTNVHGLEQSARATIVRYASIFKQPLQTPIDVKETFLIARSVKLRRAAVCTSVASLVAFIVGAVTSGLIYYRQ
jgi:hypothetical protein